MNCDWKKHTKEYLLYGLLLSFAFLYPFLHIGEKVLDGETFQWSYILQMWNEVTPFAVLLLIHIFVLLPILFDKEHTRRYLLFVLILVSVFFVYMNYQHCNRMPQQAVPIPEPPHPSILHDFDFPKEEPPLFLTPGKSNRSPRIEEMGQKRSIPGPVIMDTVIAILLIACSLAVRLMFKHYENKRNIEELEKTHIRQELEQLKSQISPHFLMNSLNNIHGMVEIDAAKAQDMILELSGMMRYVLYESSMPMIALPNEIDFLSNYISLMQVRYNTDKVAIKYTFPDKDNVCSIYIPPLLLIVFIENAFKHGINYQNSSFVNIEMSINDDKLTLHCMNSFHREEDSNSIGGIGLDNIRKRLDILYGNTYSLDMNIMDKIFIVTLTIPTRNENQMYSYR